MKLYGIAGIAVGAVCVFLLAATACKKVEEAPKEAPKEPAQVAAKVEATSEVHSMDSDSDGKVSQAEMNVKAEGLWKKADADQDGKLTTVEDQANSKSRFNAVDANHDNQISEEEFVFFWVGNDDQGRQASQEALKLADEQGAAPGESILERANRDEDSEVTYAEAAKFRQVRFKLSDTDSNGNLSLDEYVRARDLAFKQMDADSDGIVIQEEYITYWIGKNAASAPQPPAEPAKGK